MECWRCKRSYTRRPTDANTVKNNHHCPYCGQLNMNAYDSPFYSKVELDVAVQDAVNIIVKTCVSICDEISTRRWKEYKHGDGPGRADPHFQGLSMGAEECEEAIRKKYDKEE